MTLYEACAIAEGFSENEVTIQDQLNAWSFLIKTKAVNQLQGWYGRTAAQLIDQGVFDQFGNFKGGSIYQGGGFFNGKKVYYDMDGKAYTLDEDNDSDFKSGDMAIFGDALDSVIEVYFNEDDEDADDEYFINNTYLHVKLIPNNV